MLLRWGCIALVGACGFLGAATVALYRHNAAITNELIEAQIGFESCNLRLINMMEDRVSDRAIDSIPDDELLDLADPSWLLPPARGSSQ